MKGFAVFVALIALSAFAVWQHTTISSLKQRVVSLNQELDSLKKTPKAIGPKPVPESSRIICPVCHGEKVIVYDPTGTNNPLNRRTQACPVCLGVGYRVLKVPAGKKVCPDCQGMALVYFPLQPGSPVRAGNCARCGATGLIAELK